MKDNADKDTWEIHNRCYVDDVCYQGSSENTAAEGFLPFYFFFSSDYWSFNFLKLKRNIFQNLRFLELGHMDKSILDIKSSL